MVENGIETQPYLPELLLKPTTEGVMNTARMILSPENPYIRGTFEENLGFWGGVAERSVQRFNESQLRGNQMAEDILNGNTFEAWDPRYLGKDHRRRSEVLAPGLFVSVFGDYPLFKISNSGPVSLIDLGNNSQEYLLDGLTNATVTNYGAHPLNRLLSSFAADVTGGTTCLAYHDGPFVEQASRALLSLHEIYKTNGGRVWWGNDGGAANAFAMHLAKSYINNTRGENSDRRAVCFKEAYHGNIQNGGGDVTPGIGARDGESSYVLEFPDKKGEVNPDIIKLTELVQNDGVYAIVLETTQGDGGGVEMNQDFFNRMMKLAIDYDLPLIFDEIQSGFGRSGETFNYEHWLSSWRKTHYVLEEGYPQNPDNIITIVGKSLTDGVAPGSAAMFTERFASHNSRAMGVATYAAHPATTASALATVNLLQQPGYFSHIRNSREAFEEGISPYVGNGIITRLRGKGCHLFVEMNGPTLLTREDNPVGNHELAQVLLAERYRIITGTVARKGLRVHLPLVADPIVWKAAGYAIGEATNAMMTGDIGRLSPILLQQVSGLAGRTVQEL